MPVFHKPNLTLITECFLLFYFTICRVLGDKSLQDENILKVDCIFVKVNAQSQNVNFTGLPHCYKYPQVSTNGGCKRTACAAQRIWVSNGIIHSGVPVSVQLSNSPSECSPHCHCRRRIRSALTSVLRKCRETRFHLYKC
jgi:hypothetical protein